MPDLKPEEAVALARTVIDKYGADADKPSVHLAKALLAGAHERDRLRNRLDGMHTTLEHLAKLLLDGAKERDQLREDVEALEAALSEALTIAEWTPAEYRGKEHLERLSQLRAVLARRERTP